MSVDQNCITEEEAELYDRQIRLWGANVQRSLRNLKVLVIGLNGVAAEVCKNLILSGVHSVTMMDNGNVSKEDLTSQYLLYPESIGQNRAQASLKAAQVLNPNVKVSADTSSPLDKPISYYSNFDVLCVTKQLPAVVVCLNDICKLYSIKFFSGDSFGMFGYLFEDLPDQKSENNELCSSFSSALNHQWTPKTSLKKRKLEDPSYLVFKILTDFRSSNCRDPSRSFEENDKRVLSDLRNSVLKSFNVEDDILPEEYLENVFGEYGPTCSVIGGMIAQLVVKSLSTDSSTSYNLHLFNHLRCQLTGMNFILSSQSKDIIPPPVEGSVVELEE
ncbi:hypothetical protein V9T40_003469 [Parthenolecanium corni]|uniref:THIF-type NAD/FAD binding fold domain-containing protein n=1 Tax=Parthenolecanium corni TaxID=536013 RepID=A0AAN9YAF2_9HEMI